MKKIIIVFLIAALVVAGITLVKTRKTQLANIAPAKVLPVVVDTVTLEKKPVTLTLPAMGIVATDLSANLSTKISSRVKKVNKKEGDSVKKGDLLATLDASDLMAKKQGFSLRRQSLGFEINAAQENIKALEASFASAQETHSRTDELLNVKGASMEQFRGEEATLAKIKAQLSAAHNTISVLKKNQEALDQNIKEIESLITYATITAPISGTVSKRMIMDGDMTGPGKVLFQISAGSGFYINLFLPDSVNSHGIIFHGEKLALVPKNQATATGLIQYVAALSDSTGFVEGQYVNVQVVVYQGETSLLPMDAVLNVGGATFVYVMEDGKAQKIRVTIVARGSEGVVVANDLSGKTIITAKPDILLRVSTGVPILISENQKETVKTDLPQPARQG